MTLCAKRRPSSSFNSLRAPPMTTGTTGLLLLTAHAPTDWATISRVSSHPEYSSSSMKQDESSRIDSDVNDLASRPSVADEPTSKNNGSDAKLAIFASTISAYTQKEKVYEQNNPNKVKAGESRDAENAKSEVKDHKHATDATREPKRNAVKRILSMFGPRGSKRKLKSTFEIDETLHESAVDDSEDDDELTFDDSLVAIDDSLDSTQELATAANLDTLVKDQEQESDEKVDGLIKSTLVGVENEEIEKELAQDQTSTVTIISGHVMPTNLQKEAEGFLSNLVDRLDKFAACGCGRSYRNNYDDSSVRMASIRSAYSGRSIQKSDITSLNPSMEQLLVLVGDDNDSLTVDTDYGDESLASEYDDFNKAMLMLKNRAARHRLSEVRLLDKVKMEQQRGQSIGLTSTVIAV